MTPNFTPLPSRLQIQASSPHTELIMRIGMFALGAICALMLVACFWAFWQFLVAQKQIDSTTKLLEIPKVQNSIQEKTTGVIIKPLK